MKNKKSIIETHPEIAKQWHPTKNGNLKPEDVIPGSSKKVWWKCDVAVDHEWESKIRNRTLRNQGCLICSGKKVIKSNCLETTHSNLANEWHPKLNGDLTPYNITSVSSKKVWWKCDKGDDHIWQTSIRNRAILKSGCPICSGHKVVLSTSIKVLYPELVKQWDYSKNIKGPENYGSGSGYKAWWKCDKGDDHIWQTSIHKRTKRGDDCPFCSNHRLSKSNSLETVYSDLIKYWDTTRNVNTTPSLILFNSGKKYFWKCLDDGNHHWMATIKSVKESKNKCPICANRVATQHNSLQKLYPKLANEWHPTKNGNLTPHKIIPGSPKKVWWKCDKGDDHVWQTSVVHRTRNKSGCPYCSNIRVGDNNNLKYLFPKIASEWHPVKNGDLKPVDVVPGSPKKVWWKCDKGDDHIWEASIAHRTLNKSGCPICSGHKVAPSTSFKILYPELVKQWDLKLNEGKNPLDYSIGSNEKIWWKCDKGDDHIWQTSIHNRTIGGNECPICQNRLVTSSNSLEVTNPDLAKQWHPTKNGDLKPSNIVAGSGLKVWWKCDKGKDHEWKTRVVSRLQGNNCPFCTLTPQSRQELTITFEMMKLFKNINPRGFKTRLDGRTRSIDIFIPKLNLCIEFDGSYWHKNKREIDKIKSEMLLQEGFELIRVREEPLKKIYDSDVISRQPYDGKQVANDILSVILNKFKLDDKLISEIIDYQSKKDLQNEKGLEKYIDNILTEKASKGK